MRLFPGTFRALVCGLACSLACGIVLRHARAADLSADLAKVRAVEAGGKNHAAAAGAMKSLAGADAADLPQILAAMDGANEIATNWLRGAAESVAQRGGTALPTAELEKFLADTRHSPRGRRLAYEFIAALDPTAESRLIPTLLDDPSLELRRDAVAQLLADAAQAGEPAATRAKYETAFDHSRDIDQIKEAAAKLKELGAEPDIARHMGYVLQWKIVGPFDNVADKGWDTAYPPEAKVDLAAELDGQLGKVRWIDFATTESFGDIDLTKALDKHKGAAAYAYAEITVDRERPCQLRLTSVNANKVWLNGEFLTANHVYHAGGDIDQYIVPGKLKAGKNAILLKLCQNEQTEAWAQDWKFQLRVCDEIGTAILSQDRPGGKVALAR